jgi:predicted Zn finger-like uncharacterized protein
MKEQPKTVVCTSCGTKFHVPEELIRGKLVKFRCRKCGSAFDVDGRKVARVPAPSEQVRRDVTGIDTPATFSQRTVPPPRAPAVLSQSGANLHPWPEPPRSGRNHTTAPPISLSESVPPEVTPELSLPRLDMVRHPSNRGPKIAAIVALLVAAGLSGVGLAMRGSPPGAGSAAESTDSEVARPYVPPGVDPRSASENRSFDSRSNRGPTRVTDLPRAAEVDEPGVAAGTAAAKPSETTAEKQQPNVPREALDRAPPFAVAVNDELPPTPTAVEPSPAGNSPPSAGAPSNPAAALPAVPPNGIPGSGALPPPTANAPGAAAAPPAANAPAPAPPVGRAKGDFNTQAAREALEDAAGRAGKCKTIDTPTGTARVAVTFAPNGHVTNAIIESGPFVGTAAGTCVASKFRSAKVPPFSGDPVQVRKSVPF